MDVCHALLEQLSSAISHLLLALYGSPASISHCRPFLHMTECEHADAGKMLTEGVDPLRGVWKNWQNLRGSSAEHWYPDDMKAVAFVFNKVPSCYLPSEQCYCIAKQATCVV